MGEKNGQSVGNVVDIKGHATVVHPDGTTENLAAGVPVYQGDVIETDANGAVNITFNDQTVFAVSNNAKMTIDEFVYDPNKDGEGEADVSVMRGVFVYTSGFVGKEDHNDVHIKTPVGSIGIRGTILSGYIPAEGSTDEPRISLIEGAIVVKPNVGPEILLDESRETVTMTMAGTNPQNIGVIPPEQIIETYNVVRSVAPELFSPVDGVLNHQGTTPTTTDTIPTDQTAPEESDTSKSESNASQTDEVSENVQQAATENSDQPSQLTTDPIEDSSKLPGLETVVDLKLIDLQSPTGQLLTTMMDGPITIQPLLDPSKLLDFPKLDTPLLPQPPIGQTEIFYVPVNHAPFATTTTFTAFEQAGLEGGIQTLDSTRFFRDPDGNPLSYHVTGVNDPLGTLQNAFINVNGALTFTVNPSISSDATVHIFVSATDGALSSSSIDFQFNIYQMINLGGFPTTAANDPVTLTGFNGQRFSTLAGDDSVSIYTANNLIWGGIGDDTLQMSSAGNNNKVYGEAGNDTLRITTSAANNMISGGAGNDNLFIFSNGNGNSAFGGAGNDHILLNSDAIGKLNANSLLIDAGSGYDTLVLSAAGTLDLSLVAQGSLHSLERINCAASNAVDIDVKDILEHSDTGFLFIKGALSVTVTNQYAMANLTLKATSVANPYDGTDSTSYNVYNNGAGQSLYVDSTSTVIGI